MSSAIEIAQYEVALTALIDVLTPILPRRRLRRDYTVSKSGRGLVEHRLTEDDFARAIRPFVVARS
jgi:hypothetical protein